MSTPVHERLFNITGRHSGEPTARGTLLGADTMGEARVAASTLLAQGHHFVSIYRRNATGHTRVLGFTRPPRVGDHVVGIEQEIGATVYGRVREVLPNGYLTLDREVLPNGYLTLDTGERVTFERYDPAASPHIHYDPAELTVANDPPFLPVDDPITRVKITVEVTYASGVTATEIVRAPDEVAPWLAVAAGTDDPITSNRT